MGKGMLFLVEKNKSRQTELIKQHEIELNSMKLIPHHEAGKRTSSTIRS